MNQSINDTTNYEILSDKLFVGPILWSKFQKNEKLIQAETKDLNLIFDNIKVFGVFAEQEIVIKLFWDEFRNLIKGKDFIIRKANFNELDYYWTIISWDIDEPLLVIEIGNRNFILDFNKSNN